MQNQKKYYIDRISYCFPSSCKQFIKQQDVSGVIKDYIGKTFTRDEIDKIICELIMKHPYISNSMRLEINIMWTEETTIGYYHSLVFRNDNYEQQEKDMSLTIQYEKGKNMDQKHQDCKEDKIMKQKQELLDQENKLDNMSLADAKLILRTRVDEKDLEMLAPDVAKAILTIRDYELAINNREKTTVGIEEILEKSEVPIGDKLPRKNAYIKSSVPERLMGYEEDNVIRYAHNIVLRYTYCYQLNEFSKILHDIAENIIHSSYATWSASLTSKENLEMGFRITQNATQVNVLLDEVQIALQTKCEELIKEQEQEQEQELDLD